MSFHGRFCHFTAMESERLEDLLIREAVREEAAEISDRIAQPLLDEMHGFTTVPRPIARAQGARVVWSTESLQEYVGEWVDIELEGGTKFNRVLFLSPHGGSNGEVLIKRPEMENMTALSQRIVRISRCSPIASDMGSSDSSASSSNDQVGYDQDAITRENLLQIIGIEEVVLWDPCPNRTNKIIDIGANAVFYIPFDRKGINMMPIENIKGVSWRFTEARTLGKTR